MPSGVTTLRLGVYFIQWCLFRPMVYRLPSSGTAWWCCFRSTFTLSFSTSVVLAVLTKTTRALDESVSTVFRITVNQPKTNQ